MYSKRDVNTETFHRDGMKPQSARNKGNKGEDEIARLINLYFPRAGAFWFGSGQRKELAPGDIAFRGNPPETLKLHHEGKYQERCSLQTWIRQVVEAGANRLSGWVIWWRRNWKPSDSRQIRAVDLWTVTLPARDFLRLHRIIEIQEQIITELREKQK